MQIREIFKKYDIELTDIQVKQFITYFNFLIQENEKFNLTAITEENEVLFKHFLDSVLALSIDKETFLMNAKVIDVGSGAGFPGIPIKILRPDLKLVLLDSLQKRVNFLNETIKLLNLSGIKAVHARAEDYANDTRESFDVAVSRAVAQIPTLSEYLLPLVKVGGKVIMYKSIKVEEELAISHRAIMELGGNLNKVHNVQIHEIENERAFVVLKKVKSTPSKFPRGKNLPKTNPLI